MAIAKRLRVGHDDVFGHGAFLVSEVSQVLDFDASTREVKVQARDKDTGLPLWQVEVLDADPDAGKKGRTVVVKFAAKVQPIPPGNTTDLPFCPVAFEGLSALPYVDTNGNFSRIAWSLRAEDMHAPSKAGSGSPAAKAVA